jgi:hypothetical protein
MTCTHVLGLIDAGPFADYPRVHFDAAWKHARQCATCGPALAASLALGESLASLPHPAPTNGMTSSVLARIERIEQARPAADIAPTSGPVMVSSLRDWQVWAMAFGGVAAALAQAKGVGTTIGHLSMPATIMWAIPLTVGLALYAAGLFAPLHRRSRR